MIGMKPPNNHCADCQKINFKAYGPTNPVCYERKKLNGKPAAEAVKLTQKACWAFRPREG